MTTVVGIIPDLYHLFQQDWAYTKHALNEQNHVIFNAGSSTITAGVTFTKMTIVVLLVIFCTKNHTVSDKQISAAFKQHEQGNRSTIF